MSKVKLVDEIELRFNLCDESDDYDFNQIIKEDIEALASVSEVRIGGQVVAAVLAKPGISSKEIEAIRQEIEIAFNDAEKKHFI